MVGDRGLVSPRSVAASALRWVDRTAFRGARLVVADTEAQARYFTEHFELPSERVAACFVGADDRLFEPGPRVSGDFTVLFVGKLDTWSAQEPGVPADLPRIAFPLAPKTQFDTWDAVIGRTQPLTGRVARQGDELAMIIYTSGSTGQPKGVMHSFERSLASMAKLCVNTQNSKMPNSTIRPSPRTISSICILSCPLISTSCCICWDSWRSLPVVWVYDPPLR